MRSFLKTALFLLVFAFTTFSSAEQLTGYFRNNAGSYSIKPHSKNNVIQLFSYSVDVEDIFQRLKTGDLVTLSGELTEQSFVVTGVDFIGLRELLGIWATTSNEVFHFQSFTTASKYLAANGSQPPQAENYQYSLSPDDDHKWRIFLSTDTEVLIGILRIKKNTAVLQLIDSETGETSKDIELTRIQGYQ